MSNAPVTEAELHAHVDGHLSPERAADVEAWLSERPDEAARLLSYRSQRDALRAVLDPVIEEPLPPELDLRLRERRGARWPELRRLAVAASAAGLLLLGGASGWALRGWSAPPTTGTAALAREAAASYAVYANDTARPVELAADQRHTLDDWFSERLSRPIAAPDLESAGLRLIGGRLVATEHGPAGLYLYRDAAGRRVALYVRVMEVEGTDRMTRREQGDVRGWTWADNGLGFGVFGAAPEDFLHAAADRVRAQYRPV
jgi:anti-sigma factor RsiW